MRILVTGAYGGIGTAVSEYLSKGHDVVRVGHNSGDVRVDVFDPDSIQQMLGHVQVVDALVNCAGVNIDGMAHRITPQNFMRVIDANLGGSFLLANALLPKMRERGFGRLIFLSSVVAHYLVVGTTAYAASKSGLEGLVRTMAYENGRKGITCNCIAMGYFNAGMGERLPESTKQDIANSIAVGRFGEPKELCMLIDQLLDNPYITGQTIHLNGGLI